MPAQRMNWEEILSTLGKESAAREGPPAGIGLESHAELSAEIAEGDRSSAEILATRELSEEAWLKATMYWMGQLAEDTQKNGAAATLPLTYSEAFTKRQDALKPLPPLSPAEWATLTVEMQSIDNSAQALARRNLSQADFSRLNRHFAKRLPRDPIAHYEYIQTFNRLQERPA